MGRVIKQMRWQEGENMPEQFGCKGKKIGLESKPDLSVRLVDHRGTVFGHSGLFEGFSSCLQGAVGLCMLLVCTLNTS